MQRLRKKLTARTVATITKPGLVADGGGLYLHVSASGAKSWIFRWSRDHKSHDMGLGTAGDDDVTLAEARELATDARRRVREGGDPIEDRRAKRTQKMLEAATGMTFRQCAEAYIKAYEAGWKNPKHAAQWPASLGSYAFPIFGSLPIQAVDVGLVMKALEPIWTTKPETASRVRGRIEAVIDWATARGYRQGENPARWRGHLENLLPKKSRVARVEHYPAWAYPEIGRFITELRQQEGIATAGSESGTRCSLRAFIRSAGTTHSRSATFISDHVAPITSLVRAAVRIVNSSARAAIPSCCRSSVIKRPISG